MKNWSKLLAEREQFSLKRKLVDIGDLINLSSNDYLGIAKDSEFINLASDYLAEEEFQVGSTGSRLISGNSSIIQKLESKACKLFQAESATFLASGYQANLALFSCIGSKESLVIYDESVHASIRDGLKLSACKSYKFKHNQLEHLELLLERNKSAELFVCIESLYSMDGDFAPLQEISALCSKHKASLIVDEAHSFGLFGESGLGLTQHLKPKHPLIRMIGFGKAAGCSGGLLLGPAVLKDFLVNFSRPFIYSTAPNNYQVAFAMASLDLIVNASHRRKQNQNLIENWNNLSGKSEASPIIPIYGSSEKLRQSESNLRKAGYYIKSVYPPTVKEGNQMLRLCICNHLSVDILADVYRKLL